MSLIENEARSPSPVRRLIANRMMASLQGSAQVTYHTDTDVTELMGWRGELSPEDRPGLEDCVIAAVARAIGDHPHLNATVTADTAVPHASVNVAVAVDTPTGLLAPVLTDAQTKTVFEIARERRELVRRALLGRLKVSEMKGGTFTVSNLGSTPVRYFTPIINDTQAAILGLGRIASAASFDPDGVLVQRRWLPLSLTADHRWIDGAPAGRFLGSLTERLAELPKMRVG